MLVIVVDGEGDFPNRVTEFHDVFHIFVFCLVLRLLRLFAAILHGPDPTSVGVLR